MGAFAATAFLPSAFLTGSSGPTSITLGRPYTGSGPTAGTILVRAPGAAAASRTLGRPRNATPLEEGER